MKLTVTRDEVINAIKNNSTLDKAAASLGINSRKLYDLRKEMDIADEEIFKFKFSREDVVNAIKNNKSFDKAAKSLGISSYKLDCLRDDMNITDEEIVRVHNFSREDVINALKKTRTFGEAAAYLGISSYKLDYLRDDMNIKYEEFSKFSREDVVNAIKNNKTLDKAAESLGINIKTLYKLRVKMRITNEDIDDDLPQDENNVDEEFVFIRENRKLKNQLKNMKSLYDKSLAALEESEKLNNVFEEINDGMEELDVHVAFESNDSDDKSKSISVPTLFLSDLHYGEFVDSKQINGLNSYNVEIANRRLENVFRRALDYMNNHLANNYYPGMVVALGGDMVSGDIHEELKETNEITTMQSCLLLTQELIKGFNFLLENGVEKLFVPCVDGNHDRSNKKIQHKNRAKSSYSYMIYNMLKFAFKDNNRVKILISTSTDLLYRVFNHTYLLTHGDQFRGGDGIIGAIGPIVRGNTKKKSRNEILGLGYDTMILGHFHQLMNFKNQIIANGSLKGYDEYAYSCNFGYERPQQAFWITDRNIGVCTFTTIIADEKNEITSMNKQQVEDSWVSFKNM